MNFKEIIAAEAASVFLNVDEFAENINIEGVKTAAVCDWSAQPKGQHIFGESDNYGLYSVHAEIQLAANIIPEPEPGQMLTINNKDWIVKEAFILGGMLELKLFRNLA